MKSQHNIYLWIWLIILRFFQLKRANFVLIQNFTIARKGKKKISMQIAFDKTEAYCIILADSFAFFADFLQCDAGEGTPHHVLVHTINDVTIHHYFFRPYLFFVPALLPCVFICILLCPITLFQMLFHKIWFCLNCNMFERNDIQAPQKANTYFLSGPHLFLVRTTQIFLLLY